MIGASNSGRRQGLLAFAVALVVLLLGPAEAARAYAPALQPGARPNVVLIVSDDQSVQTADYMKNIEGADWTDFSSYYVNTSLCCPSRATMLTGQYSHHTGIEINADAPLFDDQNTIATWLQASGYRTGMFGKYLHQFPWDRGDSYVPPGWDDWVSFFRVPGYFDYQLSYNGRVQNQGSDPSDYSTDVLAKQTVQFIRQSEGHDAQPFFAVYAPYGPHSPRIPAPRDQDYDGPSPGLADNFNERRVSEKPDWVQRLGTSDRAEMLARQRAEVQTLLSVDDGVGNIVKTLEETGELDNTVIFYVSDNGYSYGSHRIEGKECDYQECIQVPMRVRATGLGDQQIDSMAANLDLTPTIAELAGVEPTIPIDGVSLLPLLNSGTDVRHDLLVHTGPEGGRYSWGLVNQHYKYIDNRRGGIELYDLDREPLETVNLSHAAPYQGVLESMAERLEILKSDPGH